MLIDFCIFSDNAFTVFTLKELLSAKTFKIFDCVKFAYFSINAVICQNNYTDLITISIVIIRNVNK